MTSYPNLFHQLAENGYKRLRLEHDVLPHPVDGAGASQQYSVVMSEPAAHGPVAATDFVQLCG